jgi:hypothetical protein
MKKYRRKTSSVPQSVDAVMATACHLAVSDEISAVHVVTSDRPTYHDLMRYHRWADLSDLTLTVDACGVSFRSSSRTNQEPVSTLIGPLLPPHRPIEQTPWRATANAYSQGVQPVVGRSLVSSALDWLSAHGRSWYAEFSLMSEGTR